MKEINRYIVIDALDAAGHIDPECITEDYRGRFMLDDETAFGLTLESESQLGEFLREMRHLEPEDYPERFGSPEETSEYLERSKRLDQLGRRIIAYWPRVTLV